MKTTQNTIDSFTSSLPPIPADIREELDRWSAQALAPACRRAADAILSQPSSHPYSGSDDFFPRTEAEVRGLRAMQERGCFNYGRWICLGSISEKWHRLTQPENWAAVVGTATERPNMEPALDRLLVIRAGCPDRSGDTLPRRRSKAVIEQELAEAKDECSEARRALDRLHQSLTSRIAGLLHSVGMDEKSPKTSTGSTIGSALADCLAVLDDVELAIHRVKGMGDDLRSVCRDRDGLRNSLTDAQKDRDSIRAQRDVLRGLIHEAMRIGREAGK